MWRRRLVDRLGSFLGFVATEAHAKRHQHLLHARRASWVRQRESPLSNCIGGVEINVTARKASESAVFARRNAAAIGSGLTRPSQAFARGLSP